MQNTTLARVTYYALRRASLLDDFRFSPWRAYHYTQLDTVTYDGPPREHFQEGLWLLDAIAGARPSPPRDCRRRYFSPRFLAGQAISPFRHIHTATAARSWRSKNTFLSAIFARSCARCRSLAGLADAATRAEKRARKNAKAPRPPSNDRHGGLITPFNLRAAISAPMPWRQHQSDRSRHARRTTPPAYRFAARPMRFTTPTRVYESTPSATPCRFYSRFYLITAFSMLTSPCQLY